MATFIRSMATLCKQHYWQGPENDAQIEQRRHVVDVEEIKYDHVVKVDRASARDLPKTGTARNYRQAPAMPLLITLKLVRHARPRTYKTHIAFQHIKKLRQLVKTGFSQNP